MTTLPAPDRVGRTPAELPSQAAAEAIPSTGLLFHAARGVLGVGALVAAIALSGSHGVVAAVLAGLGLVALGGCPSCWIVGLIDRLSTPSAGRSCIDGSCSIRRAAAREAPHEVPLSDPASPALPHPERLRDVAPQGLPDAPPLLRLRRSSTGEWTPAESIRPASSSAHDLTSEHRGVLSSSLQPRR
ncbi:MAG: hypothetical protein AB7F97_12195 [Solirubrobacterales bacterium]